MFEGRCHDYAETGLRGGGKDFWAKQWDGVLVLSQGWVEGFSVCVVPLSTSSRTLVPRPQLPELIVVVPKLNLSLPLWVGVGAHSWQAHSLEATKQ